MLVVPGRRDGWRCQVCGSRQNLQVHHKQLRSQQDLDDDLNLGTPLRLLP